MIRSASDKAQVVVEMSLMTWSFGFGCPSEISEFDTGLPMIQLTSGRLLISENVK
jgi:hypothetical protein